MKIDQRSCVWTFLLCVAACHVSMAQEKADDRMASVINSVKSYVEAYNKKDAAAISQHWARNGRAPGNDGEVIEGRENIRKMFEEKFKSMEGNPDLSVTINQISFVTDDVAIEEGSALSGGETTSYTAVHKKEAGVWRLHSIREQADEQAAPVENKLEQLDWLVGEWVDESDEAIVRTSVRWSANKNFLVSNFDVQMPNADPLKGTQIIGYDRSKSCIRAWTFDSSGGLTQSTWKRKGKDWSVKVKRVMPDGNILTATNHIKPKNENEFVWSSTNRKIGDEEQPDMDPVVVHKLK